MLIYIQVEGATIIRAFRWQNEFEVESTKRLEQSQGPFYLLLCFQRWLNIVLDLLIAGVAASVIALVVAFQGTTTAPKWASLST